MARMNPYLSFPGTCREAMTFYQRCLGGTLEIQKVGDSPAAQQMPAEAQENVIHSVLNSGGIVLMAADFGEPGASMNGVATLCINGEDRGEVTACYEKLSEGANITQPLKEEFFGIYGALTDRYGINWMFQAN